MKTFNDFVTRTEFVNYLGLYKSNKSANDFIKIDSIQKENYDAELIKIHSDIELIQETWNNQSVNAIEKSVAKQGQRQLDIMQGQKTEKLLAGYKPDQPMYRVNNCSTDSYFYELADTLGLKNSLARYHVQFPGEVTAWHTDIFSPSHEFLNENQTDLSDESVGRDKNIRRLMIALEDWQPGQFLLFGNTPWLNWSAGDVIYWDYGVPHGSANMGYAPRVSVSITGQITDQFTKLCNHARNS